MTALTQKFQHIHEENGNFQNCVVDDETTKAGGNLLKGNADIDAHQKAHGGHVSRYGFVALHYCGITASQICTHAAEFCLGCKDNEKFNNIKDPRDPKLHAIMCLGLNLDLRYMQLRSSQ